MLMATISFLYSLYNNVAAQISNLGMVNCLSGLTIGVEHRSSQDVFLILSVNRI